MVVTRESGDVEFSPPVIARVHRGFLVEDTIGFREMVSEKPRLRLHKAMHEYIGQIINTAAIVSGLGEPKYGGVDQTDRNWRLYVAMDPNEIDFPGSEQVMLARGGIQRLFSPPFSERTKSLFRSMGQECGFRYPGDAVAFGPTVDLTLPTGPDSPTYFLDSPPNREPPTGLLDWYSLKR